jgi:hypothetical protein
MIELLDWIFQDIHHFLGTAILIVLTGRAIGWIIHGKD